MFDLQELKNLLTNHTHAHVLKCWMNVKLTRLGTTPRTQTEHNDGHSARTEAEVKKTIIKKKRGGQG